MRLSCVRSRRQRHKASIRRSGDRSKGAPRKMLVSTFDRIDDEDGVLSDDVDLCRSTLRFFWRHDIPTSGLFRQFGFS